MNANVILSIRNLPAAFDLEGGSVRSVDGLSFDVAKGRTVGIVGESRCGKSVTALSIMRLLPQPMGRLEGGQIQFGETDIAGVGAEQMHTIRGNRIAMIFQEPMTALNPVHRIGRQLGEVFKLHFNHMERQEIRRRSMDLLRQVGIPDPSRTMTEYPHQISGGMRQRVMIAMSLACKPDILIADEPTTALDVTIQAQILALIKDLQRQTGMAVIFITHDLGVIAEICDDVVVMYAGRVAESGPVDGIFFHPKHPYTMGLLSAIPRLENPRKSRLRVIRGVVPSLDQLPPGCRFQNRCPYVMSGCSIDPPPLVSVAPDHKVSCYLYRGGRA